LLAHAIVPAMMTAEKMMARAMTGTVPSHTQYRAGCPVPQQTEQGNPTPPLVIFHFAAQRTQLRPSPPDLQVPLLSQCAHDSGMGILS
jgi:hypothetical protein